VPAVVGVPETVPELEIVTPAGRPVADQVYGAVPPDALSVNELIGVPTVPLLLPGLVTVTVPVPPLGVHVGSPVCAGTETAFHTALTALN